jgi:hypothetical protein
MHGLSLKSNTRGTCSTGKWPPACTTMARTKSGRTRTLPPCPVRPTGGAGTLADGSGHRLEQPGCSSGIWRTEPSVASRAPTLWISASSKTATSCSYRTSATSPATGSPRTRLGALNSNVGGETRPAELLCPGCLGLCPGLEDGAGRAGCRASWTASSGYTQHPGCGAHRPSTPRPRARAMRRSSPPRPPSRGNGLPATVLKASVGRAIRMPDGRRAVWRDFHHQLAIHQRPQLEARALLDHRAECRA